MANNNPFTDNQYDLGIGDEYGYDRDAATESILRTAYTNTIQCYVCTSPNPKYRIKAKHRRDNTAQIQNGQYICGHCLTTGTLDSKRYGLAEL